MVHPGIQNIILQMLSYPGFYVKAVHSYTGTHAA